MIPMPPPPDVSTRDEAPAPTLDAVQGHTGATWPNSVEAISALIERGRAGLLTRADQAAIADHLAYYRGAADRLESTVHYQCKLLERFLP